MTLEFAARVACACLLVAVHAAAEAADDERTLTILSDGHKCEYQAEKLLKDAQTITLRDLAAYKGETRTFAVVPMATILKCIQLPAQAVLEIVAHDGYATNVATDTLFNTAPGKAIAYLAVEDPANPWPVLGGGPETPGPFALIWKDPQLSDIGGNQWPFRFNRVLVRPLESTYPQLLPDAAAAEFERLQSGYQVFVTNCKSCHKLNQVGPADLGPDLNYPMSPTRYFAAGILKQYIRNPQSVRAHPRSAMGPFPVDVISDAQLDNLILYLQHMSNRKLR